MWIDPALSAQSSLLIEAPELLVSERLLLCMPRAGQGLALNAAVLESLDQLRPWADWAQQAPSVEQTEAAVRQQQADFLQRKSLPYLVHRRESGDRPGALLGAAGLQQIDWTLRSFEIGYWLRSSACGQGHASEAVLRLSQFAFERYRARRVQLRIDERNARSRAVAERCGFELEGVLRQQALDVRGQPCNTCIYARLA